MQKLSSTLFKTSMRAAITQANCVRPLSLYALPSKSFGILNKMGVPDITEEIQKDHRELESHYKNYKAAKSTEESNKWFNLFLWEICRHSAAEEIIMYNLMELQGEEGKKLSEKSREDHRNLKVMLEDLRNEKDEKAFEAKFDKVYTAFQDHIKMEETDDVDYIKKNVSTAKRATAAKMFSFKKNLVPTRPHPEIPDKPTTVELALGMLAYPVDKMKDLFTEFPDKKK